MVQVPLTEAQDWSAHRVYRLGIGDIPGVVGYLVRSIYPVHKDSDMCIEHLSVDIQVGEASACHQFLGLEELEDSEQSVGFGDMAREYYKATCEAVILTIWFWGSDPMGNRGNTDRIPNL